MGKYAKIFLNRNTLKGKNVVNIRFSVVYRFFHCRFQNAFLTDWLLFMFGKSRKVKIIPLRLVMFIYFLNRDLILVQFVNEWGFKNDKLAVIAA